MKRPGPRTGTYLASSHDDPPNFDSVSHRMEIRMMNRKWLAFPLSAGVLLVLGLVAGPGHSGGLRRRDAAREDHGEGEQAQLDDHQGHAQQGEFRQVPERRREKRQRAGEARQGGQADQGCR